MDYYSVCLFSIDRTGFGARSRLRIVFSTTGPSTASASLQYFRSTRSAIILFQVGVAHMPPRCSAPISCCCSISETMAVIFDIGTGKDGASTRFGGRWTRIRSGEKSTSRNFSWHTSTRIAASKTCSAVTGPVIVMQGIIAHCINQLVYQMPILILIKIVLISCSKSPMRITAFLNRRSRQK